MSRRGRSAHKGSDVSMTGGVMNYYHITPMSKAKEKELFRSTNIHAAIRGKPGPVMDSLRIRAKRIESKINMARQTSAMPDMWFCLVDVHGKKQGKHVAMSFAEAKRRNETIKDLGLQWTRGEP